MKSRISSKGQVTVPVEVRARLGLKVVWAEVRAHFPSGVALAAAMDALGGGYDPVSHAAALTAGALWREGYGRKAGGPRAERKRIVADYLIGAHARHHADALLTRDRGFDRSRFRDLLVVDPSKD